MKTLDEVHTDAIAILLQSVSKLADRVTETEKKIETISVENQTLLSSLDDLETRVADLQSEMSRINKNTW